MNYKGYSARIEFDAEDEILVGRLIGINDIVGFHADDAAGIRKAFEEAVDSYVELAGESAQKPFSGKMMFRVDPDIHARAAARARAAGMSLNQWGVRVIEHATRVEGSRSADLGERRADALKPSRPRRSGQQG
jgi:predicted HicB family RNase H-like nuclease